MLCSISASTQPPLPPPLLIPLDSSRSSFQAAMADLSQPLLASAGNGDSNGNSSSGKLPTESPFAAESQQDVEAARPAAARKDGDTEDAGAEIARKVAVAIWLSLIANVLLVVVKTAAYFVRWGAGAGAAERARPAWDAACLEQVPCLHAACQPAPQPHRAFSLDAILLLCSGSMAVLASAVDSVIDLLSQFVIWLADWAMARKDERYPAGKARLEPISVLACAFIMVREKQF